MQTALSTESLVENTLFTVTVTVGHPNPAEVRVQPPPFSDYLELESVRTEGGFLKDPSGVPDDEMTHVTVISFVFLPVKSGRFTLEPFEIVTPEKTAVTEPIPLSIRGSPDSTLPQLRWRSPARLITGERGVVTLELLNPRDVERYAENPYFEIEAPPNAIIDRIFPLEKSGPSILLLNIIALDGTSVSVKGRSRYSGKTFPLPPLNLAVEAGRQAASATPEADSAQAAAGSAPAAGAADSAPAAGFGVATGSAADAHSVDTAPDKPPAVDWDALMEGAGLFQNEYRQTLLRVRADWEKKAYAEALVTLRHAERGFFLAPAFKRARMELEKNLNLDESRGESRFMFIFFAIVASCTALAYILTRRVYTVKARKTPTGLALKSRPQPATRAPFCNAPIFLACAAALLLGAAIAKLAIGAVRNEAVLRETPAFKAPENTLFDGQPHFTGLPHFNEGQYGAIVSRTDLFYYIKTPAGRAGWVPKDNVIRF